MQIFSCNVHIGACTVQSFKNGGITIPVGLGVKEYHPGDEGPVVSPGFFAKFKRTRCIQKLTVVWNY